ncbi:MAG: winged helix-turn-helix domain-containing protein [bacterium]|nr:winged helix-turn-helix domain-containing protein [bacterium]
MLHPIIILIIGIVIGFAIAWFIKPQAKPTPTTKAANYRQQEKKQKNKERILDYLKEHGRGANDDFEQLLGVSDATATNYLNELEDEGSVRQVGSTGQSVYYELS